MKILILSLISFSAFANTSINTTTTKTSSSFLKKLIPTRVGYFSDFAGPSLGSGDRAEADGTINEGGINTWNQVSVGWKINDNLRVVANPRFGINHNAEEGKEFEFLDPVVGIAGTWYKNGNLTFGGGINTITPLARTQSTIDKGRIFNPGGFQSLNYKINESFSVGSWGAARLNFYDGSEADDATTLSFFVAPLATYSLNDKVSFSAYYWINGDQTKKRTFKLDNTDSLGLMSSISINKLISVSPIVSFYQRNGADLNKANLNVWFSGRFF